MNNVTPLILLAGVLALTACSETANSNSNKKISSPTTSLGNTSNVESKAIPAIVVEQPKQVVAEPVPAVSSSFTMTAKQEKRFNNYDANGDGGVTESEYAAVLSRHFEKTSSDKDASKVASNRLKKLDLNGDGTLNAEEFSTTKKK